MFMAFNKIDYISKYNKSNYKMYQFRVKRNDNELINKLDSINNKNQYISSLIRKDINPDILTIKEIKNRIKHVMTKHHVKDVYLFGSYARGEANKNSDVDIYCDSGDVNTLIAEVSFVNELEEALNKKVDLVTIGSKMDDYFKEEIEKDAIKLFI